MFTKVSGHIWVKEREGHYGGEGRQLPLEDLMGPASLIRD